MEEKLRNYEDVFLFMNCGLYDTNSLRLGCLLGAFTLDFDFTSLSDPSTVTGSKSSAAIAHLHRHVRDLHTCIMKPK